MARPALRIELAKKDRAELQQLLRGGIQPVRVVLRALALPQLAAGASAPQVAKVVPVTPQAIRNLLRRYQQEGLERGLHDKARPGKSLTNLYGEEVGGEIREQFTVHYTPTHASWLNPAAIAISLFSRQCLGKRRIPNTATLRRQTAAWNRRVNRHRVKINWRFDRRGARRKFGYKYQSIKRSTQSRQLGG